MVVSTKLKARSFKAKFLEAGVVAYEIKGKDEKEVVLIRPENLDKIAQDFKGAHIIVNHLDVDLNNTEVIVGYVTNVWIDDGWAWCDFTVNDDEAISLIEQGFAPSCAYHGQFAEGGTYHNLAYEKEIIGGKAVHIAIVEHPRYEDAEFFENSTNKKTVMLFKFKKEKIQDSPEVKEIELKNAKFEIEEGVVVGGTQLINAYRNQEEKKKEEETTKFNAGDEVEIDGKRVKMSELIKAFKARQNAGDDEEEDKKKENTGDDKDKKENQDETDEERKKREKSRTEAAKNSIDANKIKAAKDRYDNGKPDKKPKINIVLDSTKFALGNELYGPPQSVSK